MSTATFVAGCFFFSHAWARSNITLGFQEVALFIQFLHDLSAAGIAVHPGKFAGIFTHHAFRVDYLNLLIYVPMLNWCLAIWIAHAFTIHQDYAKRYIFIIVAFVASIGTFAAHILAI